MIKALRTTPVSARHWWMLASLVVLGLVLRLGLALWLGIGRAPEAGTDAEEYDAYAWNLLQGRGYRGMSPDVADRDHLTAYRPPGTSLIWGGLFSAFGHRYDVVRIFNCAAGAATIWLVYGVGIRSFGPTAGLLGAGIYAVWPISLLYSASLLSEPPGALLFMAYLLACLMFADHPGWKTAVTAGALLGLTLLTRPNPLFMLPLTAVWALWQFCRDRRTLVLGLAIPVITLLTMSPWWVRNALVFGRFIPLSTMGGSALLQGNNRIVAADPSLYGYSVWDSKIPEYREALRSAGDEIERDRRAGRFAIEWLKANPDLWPQLAWNKLVRGWTPFLQPSSPRLYRIGTLISWGPVLLLFLIGFIPTGYRFLRDGHPAWILHLAILGSLPLTVLLFGELRYRFLFEPICILVAAATMAWFLTRHRRNGASQSLDDLVGDVPANETARLV
jgi:4-amino-4-deoxy-L-arabinose transferase-like glycosyltransferase